MKPLYIPNKPEDVEEEDLVDVNDFIEGLVTDADPKVLPDNALTTALNVEYLRGMLFRRNGLNLYSNTKPNSNKVLNITAFYQTTTGLNLVRADRETLHRSQSSGWSEYTPNPAGIALSGGDLDYFQFAVIDDRIFFTNGGVDPIRELDPTAAQYKALGNAPRYKYITAAFDRVIGVNRIDTVDIPTEVGWSGNRNYDEWDPLVDITAGINNLVASPSAISDELTGVFFNASSLILPRQRSIWLATHLDSGSNPFNFYSAVPRVGCDLPRTIKLTEQGLVFTSFQASSIYVWDLQSSEPIPLIPKIARYLKSLIQNAYEIWATYSYDTKKYSLYMSSTTTSTVTCVSYDFNNKNYTIHEYPLVSAVEDVDFASSSTTIDELVGTIEDLVGSIDSLGGLIASSTRFFGHGDGEISTYAFFSGLENNNIIQTDDFGQAFSSDIRSKIFELPLVDAYINLIRFSFVAYTEGSMSLYYSKDDGNNWTLAKTFTVTSSMLEKGQILQLRKSIKAGRIMWRIISSDVMMSHNGLNVKIAKSGVAKNGSLG